MTSDTYQGLAERYDWMEEEQPNRQEFFRQLFAKNRVHKVLDCACGTGHDLIMFHSLGCEVFASDLSESMLSQARRNLSEAGLVIPLVQADFRNLPEHFGTKFDAVVCLTNSINELLLDDETLEALISMKSVLRPNGILVFDQGQTDASMKDPPAYDLVVNNRDWTRFFVLNYDECVMEVNIFDFTHTDTNSDYQHSQVLVRIRLLDSWIEMLKKVGFSNVEIFESWEGKPYCKQESRRIIVVATN